ncbi:MAG TPA: FAD-dependent oxidoreductase [Candidatus Gallimonas intestinavium]|uniref:FAD-dependent oxidoreductase n=1 Tax=Candidatus Gallimonas intestinavium TaxID=2838603 RepID=A0A9D2JZ98_9FIRM|nr:FAD-dependent oxidoreductase [Candidatus Gallimonas intestinavium]
MKVIIVGGVAGGASCAARLRRLSEDAEIVLFERGENISYANCGLPYYLGGIIREESALTVASPALLRDRFRIDVRIRSEVTAIDREKHTVTVRTPEGEYQESYEKLVLTPGASPKTFGLGGEGVFTLRDVHDTLSLDAYLKGTGTREVLIAGGGFIGVEMAENLVHRGLKVTLAEFAPQIMPPFDPEHALLLQDALEKGGVTVRTNTGVKTIEKQENALIVTFTDGFKAQTGAVVLALGVAPETALAKAAGLKIAENGGVAVDDRMCTSDPDIFAAGDAITVLGADGKEALVPLAGPANRQGRSVAANVLGGREENGRSVLGASVVRAFGTVGACVGQNEKQLKRAGTAYRKIYIFPLSHAGYYPGGTSIAMKLLYDAEGRILGAQAVGSEYVEKQIDVIAAVMKLGGTVHDLAELELCYAPPFNSAKSPVNMLGFVAENELSGLCPMMTPDELTEDTFLLDVRNPQELLTVGAFPSAVNIPLDVLRDHLDELPKDRSISVACMVGLRGYIATRILRQNGFDAIDLSGGYRAYALLKRAGLVRR